MRRLLCALSAIALLAACTSSGGDGPSGAGPTTGSGADEVTKLSARVLSGSADLTSAHLTVKLTLAGTELSGTGVERITGQAASAFDISLALPGAGDVRVISVGDDTYAKLPAGLSPPGKQYAAITPGSGNPTVQLLAPYVGAARAALSPGEIAVLVAAAPSAQTKGPETVAGVDATHYALEPKLDLLDESMRADFPAAGKTLPLDIWLDGEDRLVRVVLGLSAQGQPVPIDIAFTDFNEPVTITAPPASEVGG